MKKLTILAAACLALAACGSETPSGADVAAVSDAELTGNKGQVLSVIQVPGYTYVEVRNNGRNLWLAGNPVELAEGEIISWADAAPQPASSANSGVVKSTENAAGYTYIECETDAGQVVWLATPEMDMSVGARVSWQGGSKMSNFTSSSLDRTFDEILFVQGVSATP